MKKATPAPARFWAKVDKGDADSCWEWTGYRNAKGYGVLWLGRAGLRAHRYAFELVKGPIPKAHQIDHMCHNRGCVNPAHLRAVTPKQNTENYAEPLPAHNKSGYRGVHWGKHEKRWIAEVVHNGRHHYVGRFATAAEAGEAARLKRLELHTHNDLDRAP